jgi:phenylacetic acid degradation operon negative regulatory protein
VIVSTDDLAPLPARSVALSLLLGSHPDRMSPAALTRAGEHFGIPASTLRVALTRAVAAGDLRRVEGDYVLGERLVARQRRQDEAVEDAAGRWDGTWEMAIVVVGGRPPGERATLRDMMVTHRLAELREGVWTRPANLRRERAYAADPSLETCLSTFPGDQSALARRLWDLAAWSKTARDLLRALENVQEPARRLAVAAQLVRHLTTDPLLPSDLLPSAWPGQEVRTAYARYQAELIDLAVL